jgi:hypothetical protein
MPIALYFDVHVDSAIVNQLRLRKVDVLRAQDDGTDTLADELLLNHATKLGRPLVTNDIRFHAMARKWQEEAIAFCGIIFAHQMQVSLNRPGVEPETNSGIWVEDSQGLHVAALEGNVVPGSFSETFRWFGSPQINARNQVAFYAETDTLGNLGVWATDTSHNLHLIAKSGDTIEVAPGDLRTISSVTFQNNTGNDDGRPSGFNDRGQLVFSAIFTDGSQGVFVSNAVAIPEPSSFVLAILMISLPLRRGSVARQFGVQWPYDCR